MSRTRALAATLAVLAAAPMAGEAQAWPFGKKDGAVEAKPSKPAKKADAAKGDVAEAVEAPAPPATPQERAAALRLEPLAQVAFWMREFDRNPADVEAGVRLAAALRALGQAQQAGEAAQRVLVVRPDHVDALMELARAHIARNQGFYAIEPLRRVRQLTPNDWRPLSLLGVAFDQAQRTPEARAAWEGALRLSPDNPQVLTNIALSHMAHGQAEEAEVLLRRAAARPDADIRVRQNLALVLGLRGRTQEAESLLRQDLPPEVVNQNLAWIRARSGPGAAGRTWDSLQSAN